MVDNVSANCDLNIPLFLNENKDFFVFSALECECDLLEEIYRFVNYLSCKKKCLQY